MLLKILTNVILLYKFDYLTNLSILFTEKFGICSPFVNAKIRKNGRRAVFKRFQVGSQVGAYFHVFRTYKIIRNIILPYREIKDFFQNY